MKKLLAALVAATLLVMGMAGIADAQAPTGTLALDPATVDEAGSHDFTVTLGEFSPGLAVFVLPCTAPPGGDMAAFDPAAACDQSQLTPVTIGDDGTAEASVTYDVTDDGLVVVAGDAAQSEIGLGVVPPPGAGGGDLPETGVETGLLAVVATTLVAGGALVVRQSHRLV